MALGKINNRLLQGIGASPGIAIGQVRITDRSRVVVYESPIEKDQVPEEIARF